MNNLILAAFALSGVAALIYEVTWTRALALIMGSTTYALSTMLATFMAGLAIGGIIGGNLSDRHKNLYALFAICELGIGAFGLITVPLINALPSLYLYIYQTTHAYTGLYFVFQFLLCSLIMLVPTTLMGATFPVVSKIVTENMEHIGRGVGRAYSLNTFGAIFGSLAAGFLLIPLFGVKFATFTAASLNIAAAIVVLLASKTKMGKGIAATMIFLFAFSAYANASTDMKKWHITFYTASRAANNPELLHFDKYSKLLYSNNDIEGTVALWENGGYLKLQNGGKLEGTGSKDMANTLLLAYLPIASHPNPKSFLNIGLGVGVTLDAAKQHIKDISLAEINRSVIEAISLHGPRGLLDGVDIVINDARNYLLLTDRKFDIISSEPSYPSDPGTANLFTREFFEMASTKLNSGGVYCQWLPYYQLTNDDVTMMLKTFGSVFNNVYLWKQAESQDLIMVGSNEPFHYSADTIIQRTKALNVKAHPLEFVLSRSPEQIKEIIANNPDVAIHTDDRPILEFRVAHNTLAK